MRKRSLRYRPKPQAPIQMMRVGVTWYDEDQWHVVKEAATDPELFEATYPEWLEMAENALAEMKQAGVLARRVLVNGSELLAWCKINGKDNNSAARAEYVAMIGRDADA